MNQTLLLVCFLFIGVLIILSKPENKIFWLFIGYFMVPPGVVIFDRSIYLFFTLCLLSTLLSKGTREFDYRNIPIKRALILFIGGTMLIGFFDSRLGLYQKISRPMLVLFESAFTIFIVFFALRNKINFNNLLDKFYLITFIACIYGLFCRVTHSNPYIDIISQSFRLRNISKDYMTGLDGRFRISSFTFHPYFYGIFLVFILFFVIYSVINEKKIIKKYILYCLIALILLNIFLTDSRTILLILVLGISILIVVLTNKRNVYKLFIAILFLIIALIQIPFMADKADAIVDIFLSGGTKVEGSNINLREVQFILSLGYFYKSPIFGNGLNYIYENMGFAVDVSDRLTDSDLYAFESHVYILMIEQGIIGIFIYLLLFISVLLYHIKSYIIIKDNSRYFVLVNMILVFCYFIFIIATGTISSFQLFCFFVAFSLRFQVKARARYESRSLINRL
ncbi:O-antigen ligase family protein [Arcicella lustrica]|uniref:O-antigen ligase family protein n=1 Tax=Arcicella lustrica TaxID=2984196 RepID=A0ABU5SMT8_9BACT|nr:O-antigen ligase family protein [Arcicella sp. DC25W]MEA5428592.1 O-antigen ligase family protein [Arcicella sp. DC25W]